MAAANSASLNARQIESYVDTGHEASIEVTLSATPGTVTTITIPDNAKGFKIFPRSSPVRFAVNNTSIAAVGASSATTIAANAFGAGAVAKADLWETRLLPSSGTGRTISLRSTAASVVVDLEVF